MLDVSSPDKDFLRLQSQVVYLSSQSHRVLLPCPAMVPCLPAHPPALVLCSASACLPAHPPALWCPACSFTRELHDTPALGVGRAAISYLLAACEGLNPTNMASLAELLVGPSVAAGVRCLCDYPKGRFLLRLAARQWHLLTMQLPAAAGMHEERGRGRCSALKTTYNLCTHLVVQGVCCTWSQHTNTTHIHSHSPLPLTATSLSCLRPLPL